MKPDHRIISLLIGQVSRACPKDKSEQSVKTIITRPMWRRFMLALGDDPESVPTEWKGLDTKRVYGSETVVVEGEEEFAISYAPEQP